MAYCGRRCCGPANSNKHCDEASKTAQDSAVSSVAIGSRVDDLCVPVEFLSDEQAVAYRRVDGVRSRGEMRRSSRTQICGGRIGRWRSPGFCARSGVRPVRRAVRRGIRWRPAGRGSAVPDGPETLFTAADPGPFRARLGPRRRR